MPQTNTPIPTVRLGKTDLNVSRLSLGGLFVRTGAAELADARAAIERAAELGVNYIDTAPGYGDSEKVLGQILPKVEQPLIVSTKLGGRPEPFDPKNKAQLRESLKISLDTLGREAIDILFVHEPDRPGQYDWWDDLDTAAGPVTDLLDELKDEGLIRATGLGGTTAYTMARLIRTGKFDVLLTAFNYSLLFREAEHEVLPAAAEQGMGVVVGSPLQQGSLAVRRDEEVRSAHWLSKPRREQLLALYEVLDYANADRPADKQISLAELAIRFVVSNPGVHTVLMGARSVSEVEANVAAVQAGALPSEVIKRIDQVAAMVPFRPFDEPSHLPLQWNPANQPGPMR